MEPLNYMLDYDSADRDINKSSTTLIYIRTCTTHTCIHSKDPPDISIPLTSETRSVEKHLQIPLNVFISSYIHFISRLYTRHLRRSKFRNLRRLIYFDCVDMVILTRRSECRLTDEKNSMELLIKKYIPGIAMKYFSLASNI